MAIGQSILNQLYRLGGAEDVALPPPDPHAVFGPADRQQHFQGASGPESMYFLQGENEDLRRAAQQRAQQAALFQARQALTHPPQPGAYQPPTGYSERDPFQPLPGMQHNPDPNANPFATVIRQRLR